MTLYTFLASVKLVWNWPSLVFLTFSLADCVLTQIGLNWGMIELNGLWANCVWLKMLPATAAAVILGRRRFMVRALIVGTGLVVVWNAVMLVVEKVVL